MQGKSLVYFDSCFAENPCWINSALEKVEVFPSQRRWKMVIAVEQPIPVYEIQAAEQKLAQKYPFVEQIEIVPSLRNSSQHLISLFEKHKAELVAAVFSNSEQLLAPYSADEMRLDFHPADEAQYQQYINQEICSRLSTWYWQEYRLPVLVRVLPTYKQPALPEVTLIEPSSGNWLPEFDSGAKRSSANGKRSRSSNKLSEAQPMPVSELQEGLKTAIVDGEIWDKETTVLRDGRLVVTYSLTDFTDSILVKAFWDRPPEDTIETGDYIRVKGSVRYDPFVREIVLFMDSYIKREKQVRSDLASVKRVELHAHTKMSAMDGLTEIGALIERAAKWGHSAVAITDHGCVQAFPDAYQQAKKYGIKVLYGVEAYLVDSERRQRPYHIILIARNRSGLKNLYHLVSVSYLEHYYRHPKIPREVLNKYREGILVGSACQAGELFTAILQGKTHEEIIDIARFYDYLEIQPLTNNEFLLRDGRVGGLEELKKINAQIVALGEELGKPVVATGDVHYLDPEHEIFRRIIQAGQGYEDIDEGSGLYLRSTEEMLEEFAYLGEDTAYQVVVENPRLIAELVEDIKPVPDGFYPPKIDEAEDEVYQLSWNKAKELYGDPLPELVEARIKRELDSIIRHGFSVLYSIAHKLVKKSNEDGYLVGSRGSVGSSLVAFLTGITEVNPLPPHWRCPNCRRTRFVTDGTVGCGADLPPATCELCGTVMNQDGFDIPFETFLGFEGDKVPDIDLNFSGEYQNRAHAYVEELFGKENVFRAGTISTIAEKTAYGFVKKYAEERQLHLRNAEVNRLVQGITGVRRTTGQHPGGLIVVPRDHDILEFTPLQYPADNKDSGVVTTHFEYHAIGDQLVKLDILGHDDPTVIKELEDLTGIKASSIKLNDKDTMRLFSSVESLGITEEDIDSSVGTFGIPEFGTRFVRQMLEATRPTTLSELVRISGLSHGTDVWLNNAQDLIESQTATLREVICTRDDIMGYLINKGVEKKTAFKIMENVRKGKGLKPEEVTVMQDHDVPEWYIDSCQKIKYMFPKAHAVAYVTMAFRIAYYKVYYPLAFYASFFSVRAEDFEAQTILAGYDQVHKRIKDIERQGTGASLKDKKLLPILEVALEMLARGFEFYPVDIYNSHAYKFSVQEKGLLLPFSALPNVGKTVAQGIVTARDEAEFISVEDFQLRTRINKTAVDVLREYGCFRDLPETTQISLFGS
ncbi:MAG TPA: PolC-type DNA polymerase III [Syntrophomonadaceae bacterium]|nr:PolC-type DNA polymerase III [Syntrophomonadaceae bacterium]HQA06899.1 PolC-type DNA polymerase III [Syntrophomonadaceae bacterium]HQE22717.1 PolC-type DNA polymerase III [Syntrophomonadaceae bacterium]